MCCAFSDKVEDVFEVPPVNEFRNTEGNTAASIVTPPPVGDSSIGRRMGTGGNNFFFDYNVVIYGYGLCGPHSTDAADH